MTQRSMTVTDNHLAQAHKHLLEVKEHIELAMRHDPDPEITDARLYPPMLNNIELLMLYCKGRRLAGGPELEKETAS